jgi:predicted transcriptional regulator
MKKDGSVSIRFDPETTQDLASIAAQSNLTASDLVRRAVAEFLEKVKTRGELPAIKLAFSQQTPDSGISKVAEGKVEYHVGKKK